MGKFNVGKVVFNGPCRANPIRIDLQGTVLQTKDPSAMSGNEPAWIISGVTGLTFSGGGTINGQGEFVWKYNAGGKSLLPIVVIGLMQGLMFQKASFCTIDNINFVNAKGVHFKVTSSNDVLVRNLHITAPRESPNTDGIVISNSDRITVADCNIATGDDCVAIGDTNSFINVTRVTCGPGHGLSIGSLGKRLNEGDVKHVRVWNCTLTGTTNGARIKTYMGSHALQVQDVVFEDIIMNGVLNPVLIDQHYMAKKAKSLKQPSKVHISDVHFRFIRGTSASPIPVSLGCSESDNCEGVELREIDLLPAPGSKFIRGPLITECVNAKYSIIGRFPTLGCGGKAPKSKIKN
ncbi:hypothetical protein Leryth_005561 [Lithospermum erythrorhizon]|nr:hypothetical protein Leryth_005561 [Lithospermum erythrorhizon]